MRNLSAKAVAETRGKAIGARKKYVGSSANTARFAFFIGP